MSKTQFDTFADKLEREVQKRFKEMMKEIDVSSAYFKFSFDRFQKPETLNYHLSIKVEHTSHRTIVGGAVFAPQNPISISPSLGVELQFTADLMRINWDLLDAEIYRKSGSAAFMIRKQILNYYLFQNSARSTKLEEILWEVRNLPEVAMQLAKHKLFSFSENEEEKPSLEDE